ncbi:FRG domain-containing protein [Sutcliffiella cohnii]|uniref:FRG domain-containing protein n=1 Tax=Sutcliffiella cohnii TaxID=33932 RepID=UPI002E1C8B7F|nr:FRG domain-containing protein [Sutcliffiella cohnii]
MSWSKKLKEVNNFQRENRFVWFRGQSKSSYQLKSSLFRQDLNSVEDFLTNERARYNWFKNLGHLYHKNDEWELVYLMQHYGVKTRLLDWTESFSIALYFAANEWEDNEEISIWMLNPQRLNNKSIGTHKFFTPHNDSYRARLYQEDGNRFNGNSVALHPLRSNARIVAQQGVFTIQGNTIESLNEEFNGELTAEEILKEIRISYEYKQEVNKFLELAGIHPFSIFPDLKGLASYVNMLTDEKV